MKFSKADLRSIEGGGTALVLCGYTPFGDCRSIRHRLDMVRSQIIKLNKNIHEAESYLSNNYDIIIGWRREVKIWEFVLAKGEKLLINILSR